MLFNSYIFILLFLPLCLLGYFGLNRLGRFRLALCFLFGMSLLFYGFFHPAYLAIILSSIVLNYFLYLLLNRASGAKSRNTLLALGIMANLGILFYYKYMNFFLSSVSTFLHTDFALLNIVLPLGISFFTFQQISFLVDSWRGETGQYDFLEYACFVSYFPQLIAGPIVTHDELIPQLQAPEKKHIDWDNLARGLYLFSMGLAKKVLLADTFGNIANVGFGSVDGLDSTGALISMLAYTLQIYLDFSGYCDMAIGLGKMMNIDLPSNFNSPYKALTILDFWDRWHMTLTRFFTKYIYIPLGGSRRGRLRTYRNVFAVFVLSGLWHGAGLSFLFWGILHGAFSVLTRMLRDSRRLSGIRLPAPVSWLITFAFVNVTWVFFRANSLSEGFRLLRHLLQGNFGPVPEPFLAAFQLPEIMAPAQWLGIGDLNLTLVMAAFFSAILFTILWAPNSLEKARGFHPSLRNMVCSALLLVWSVFSFSGVSTFLYFNF